MVDEKVFDNALKPILDLPIDGEKDEALIVVAKLDAGYGICRNSFTVMGNALSALQLLADVAESVVHSSSNPVAQALMRDKLRQLLSEKGI